MDSEFRRKNEAQFARAKQALQRFGRLYIHYIAEDMLERTPGFGNQLPEDTEYIPTGRLRGGYNYTRSPLVMTSKGLHSARGEDGPFSDYGRETLDRIDAQLEADQMGGISYLENDVAYGNIIRIGGGRHRAVGPRDWPLATYVSQKAIARKAMAGLRSRA